MKRIVNSLVHHLKPSLHTSMLEFLDWHAQEQGESYRKRAVWILGADKGIFIK